MSVFAEDFMNGIVVSDERTYKIFKINPIDFSEQENKEKGTIQVTHTIKGFEVPIYLLVDNDEESFNFGTFVGEDVPLFVPVIDEKVFNIACEIVSSFEEI